jgi:predicted XRE-type DNA-binding protein
VKLIAARQLSQVESADILEVDQPKVSALVRGKLSGFSMERLFKFLNALGVPIEIRVMTSGVSEVQASTRVVTG